jgi:hypothetical protein
MDILFQSRLHGGRDLAKKILSKKPYSPDRSPEIPARINNRFHDETIVFDA